MRELDVVTLARFALSNHHCCNGLFGGRMGNIDRGIAG